MTAARRTSRVPRQPAPVYPRDAMKGPKRAAAGILIFFAASILAVHLAYLDEPTRVAPPAGAPIAPEGLVALAVPAVSAVPVPVPARSPLSARGTPRQAPPVPTDVPIRAPAPSELDPRNRDLNACVERVVGAAAAPKATAPGRWPAVKRAREELRQRRLAARADCERQLAM